METAVDNFERLNAAHLFLKEEKKQIDINVSDHISTDDFYRYNQSHTGSGFLKTPMDLDWDTFIFEVNIKLAFAYKSRHEKQTNDYPGDSQIEFMPIEVNIEIESCLRWNAEDDEFQTYRMSAFEKRAVQRYLRANINLQE